MLADSSNTVVIDVKVAIRMNAPGGSHVGDYRLWK